MKEVLDIPTQEEQKTARITIEEMKKIPVRRRQSKAFISFDGGTSFAVPGRLVTYLKFMLSNMAEGKGFQLVSLHEDLSTQEAADILNVSRPFVVKLMEQGDIPFQKVGRHRRVKLQDLQEYESKQAAIRSNQLDFLARQAQELNMGY